MQAALDKLQVTKKVGTGNLASQLVKLASQLVQVSLQISRLQAHEVTCVRCGVSAKAWAAVLIGKVVGSGGAGPCFAVASCAGGRAAESCNRVG